MRSVNIITALVLATPAFAFFDQFFQQHQQQQQQQQQQSFQDRYLSQNCENYLCPDTLTCVKSAKHCPCPFPDSQMKCEIGDSYVCISKGGDRDCKFVKDAYNGLI